MYDKWLHNLNVFYTVWTISIARKILLNSMNRSPTLHFMSHIYLSSIQCCRRRFYQCYFFYFINKSSFFENLQSNTCSKSLTAAPINNFYIGNQLFKREILKKYSEHLEMELIMYRKTQKNISKHYQILYLYRND